MYNVKGADGKILLSIFKENDLLSQYLKDPTVLTIFINNFQEMVTEEVVTSRFFFNFLVL